MYLSLKRNKNYTKEPAIYRAAKDAGMNVNMFNIYVKSCLLK